MFEFVEKAKANDVNTAQVVDAIAFNRKENQQSERPAEELLGQVEALFQTQLHSQIAKLYSY